VRKEILNHIIAALLLTILVVVVKGWFDLSYWTIFLGAALGTILPDIDHVIYVYFLAPQELTSQRVGYMVSKKDFWGAVKLLAETRSERRELIFHTVFFQLIFLILTFFVITSTGSVFGRGLVLAFSLHLLMDQVVDLRQVGNLENWLYSSPLKVPAPQTKAYLWAIFAVLLIFGLFL